jgi:hypothetical protein
MHPAHKRERSGGRVSALPSASPVAAAALPRTRGPPTFAAVPSQHVALNVLGERITVR